jgi:hypothetical protein
MRTTALATLALVVIVGLGCAPTYGTAGGTNMIAPGMDALAMYTAVVPKGTELTVVLDKSLSAEREYDNEPFTARVLTPLYSRDGRLLVWKGAPLRGRVTGTETGSDPVLRVQFETLETVAGPVRAHLSPVESQPIAGLQVTAGTGGTSGVREGTEAVFSRSHGLSQQPMISSSQTAIGGGPRTQSPRSSNQTADSLDLSAGTHVRLRLDAPLIVTLPTESDLR